MTSDLAILSTIELASSLMLQRPVFWHMPHPLQNAILFPLRETNSTSFPASLAPFSNSCARISELLSFLRLVEIMRIFLAICIAPSVSHRYA